ncbi:5'-nucleotidase C-terminal domain-containing protein [Kosakonia sp.]|uniref:bifunctional metallophosphatase/5'-nucleotidase n=1 Tax=Kosakonia sp. TaxID=1916651 RepID=UPI0028971DDB|nr:5'-nucleotidase C-terminal domain-containing protein [Kosakonia sp.]
MKKWLCCGMLILTSFSNFARETTLTLLHTGDTHGRGMSEEGIGYGKISAYAEAMRKNNHPVLLLDVGDAVSGIAMTDLSLGVANITAMNYMRYDAFTPGNADFIFGGEVLRTLDKKANFPFVSANVYYQGQQIFNPFVIKNISGVNVGIIGVTPLNAMVATTDNKLTGFEVSDPIAAIKTTVALIKNKVDVIIVMAHLGKVDPDVNIGKLLAAVPGIDVLVDGHDHIEVPDGTRIGNTIMVNVGQYGRFLGELTLTLKDKKIVAWRERLLDRTALAAVTTESHVEAFIQQQRAKSAATLSEVVMTLPFTLDGQREHVRSGQTNLGMLLADAQREHARADIAFTVGAFLRDSIQAGPVSLGQLRNALPFTLPLVTRDMSGQQIKDFIEHNYTDRQVISGAYAHVSGMTFTVDFSRPVGDRMTQIQVNGAPLESSKIYRVACNEQVSDYGIRQVPVRDRYEVTMASLLADYVNRHTALQPPAARIHVAR